MNSAVYADADDADSDINVYCYMVEHCIQPVSYTHLTLPTNREV